MFYPSLHLPCTGKGANLNEKKEATARAVKYVEDHGLPRDTRIERVSEGTETAAFRSEFFQWDAPVSFKQDKVSAPSADVPVDVAALLARKKAEDAPVDDGSGKLTVWVVKDFKKVEINRAEYG